LTVSFSLVCITPPQTPLVSALLAIADELLAIRVGSCGPIWGFAFDVDEEGYQDGSVVAPSLLSLHSNASAADDASGFGATFEFEEAELDVRIARQPDDTGICFVEMTDRVLYEFFIDGRESELRTVLSACVRGVGSTVAVGAMEMEWECWTESGLHEAIDQGPPGYEGSPPPFALLDQAKTTRANVTAVSRDRFDIHEVSGYWVLQRKKLAELIASLPR